VYAAVEARHGGCEYTCNDKTGQAGWHLSPNKNREYLIISFQGR
jgi:hypothetical protein